MATLSSYAGRGSASGLFSSYASRAIQVIAGLLHVCPLKAERPGPMFELLSRMPCSIMSRYQWFSWLVEHYYIYSGFNCLIYTNNDGQIRSLIPFTPYSLTVYPINKRSPANKPLDDSGNYADGLTITEHQFMSGNGFYFQDHLGRKWEESKILRIYQNLWSTDSLISGNDMGRQINYEVLSACNYLSAS